MKIKNTDKQSFVKEVYDVEFAPHLGERSETFRAMLLYVESLDLPFYRIIETGCMREENDWTAGCSTVIFDRFVNFYDGELISVDNDKGHCDFSTARVSAKTKVICADSVQWLNNKSNKLKCHLLYLDSYDYDVAQDGSSPLSNPAAVHGWDEFACGFWRLEHNAMLVLDDNFDGGTRGKGARVISFLETQGIAPAFTGRQWAWVPDRSVEGAIEFHLVADGIGDAVTGYYAACGLAADGRDAVFYTKHPLWFGRVSHPGAKLLPYRERGVNANANYTAKLRYDGHWSQYFCDAIATHSLLPRFEPARPRDVDRKIHTRRLEGKYVLASPFSLHDARNWPTVQWRRLARLLLESNLQMIFTDGGGDERGARLQENFNFIGGENASCNFWGTPHEWIEDAILGASCVVSNDSGMAHFAGLLGVPCVSVHAQLKPSQLYGDLARVNSAFAQTSCAGCAWQSDRGHRAECDGGCSALASISAERVFEMVCEAIKSPEDL